MRKLWRASGVTLLLAAGAASANPLDDAKAGLQAYNAGLNATAVRLFTSAINSHRLQRSDQELAFVKRAEARIALGQGQLALADAYTAMSLDSSDNEAIVTRDRAQALLNPPTPLKTEAAATTPEPSAYLKSQDAYQQALKRYEEEKSADAKRYDEQLTRYNAELKTEEARRDRNCRAGDVSQCQAASPTVKTVAPAAKPATQPAPKTTAQSAPPPAKSKPTKKTDRKVNASPEELPRFY